MIVHLAAAGDVFGDVLFCVVFVHMMFWVETGIELCQIPGTFLLYEILH